MYHNRLKSLIEEHQIILMHVFHKKIIYEKSN